ncbi:MAG: glycosyltransferase [Candidatus Omnitrophica bacterium]|nr:glycosyltransferase [Candidatus Omnitrophota bacterium]
MPDKQYRLLHIIESLGRGGAEKRLYEDVKNLKDFQHRVCYLFPNGDLEDDFQKAGVEVDCLGMRGEKDLIGFLQGYGRLLGVISQYRPDVIHSHLFYANIMARLAAFFYRKAKYVQTIHCPDYTKDIGFIYSPYRHLLEFLSFLFKKPKFIAVSHYVKAESVKSLRLKSEEVTVIYNYLGREWFDRNQSLPADNGTLKVISVGNLKEGKGFEYLIRAARIIKDKGIKISVSIAGEGGLRGPLMRLISGLGLDSVVLLPGRIENTRDFILQSDIFVFPSEFEGLGIALIEAMSQERLCIASCVGPIPEIIEDGEDGFLVPPKDPEALAAKITECFNEEGLYPELRKKARAKARARFFQDTQVGLLRDYYRAVLRA